MARINMYFDWKYPTIPRIEIHRWERDEPEERKQYYGYEWAVFIFLAWLVIEIVKPYKSKK